MATSVRAILVIGIVIFVISFGYFSGKQMNDYRPRLNNVSTDDSKS